MLCYLMKGSNVLKRGKRIGLRKEDASGCKRREMKSRDVETKLLKEKEKRGRQEKLRRDKEELRKRKRDVLILKKLNRRKEKRKGRLRTDLQDRKRKKGKRCRTGGTKMVAIEVALGEEEVETAKMMDLDLEVGVEELGNLAKEAGGTENKAKEMNGLDHVAVEEIGIEMIETECLQDVALLLEIVMVLIVDLVVMTDLIVVTIAEMMVLLSVVDHLQDEDFLLQETAGGVEEVKGLHGETTLLPVVDVTKMIEVECGEEVVETVTVMMDLDLVEEEEEEPGNQVVEVGETESRGEMMDQGTMIVDLLVTIVAHVMTAAPVVALNAVDLEMMTTDPQ